MFCPNCGKQIESDSKFCIYCGSKIINSNVGNTADIVKDAEESISNVVMQSIETTRDNNYDGSKSSVNAKFFTKNKYRNIKILTVLLIVIFILNLLFSGDSSNYFEEFAKDKSEEFIVERMLISGGGYTNVKAYDVDLVAKCHIGDISLYTVTMSIKGKDSSGKAVEENYYVTMLIKDIVSKSAIKNGTVSDDDYGAVDFRLIQGDMSAYKKQLKKSMEDLQKAVNDNNK